MPSIRSTIVSPELMKSTLEQIYATFALPLPGETCRGQLAAVMHEFVKRVPELEIDYPSFRQQAPEARSWNPSNYVVHVKPEPTGLGVFAPDENRDLRVKATYRRNPESIRGPEFVQATCSFHVIRIEESMRIEVLCEIVPLGQVKLEPAVRHPKTSSEFEYVLEPQSLANMRHCLQISLNEISEEARSARRARVLEVNQRQQRQRENCLGLFQQMLPRGLFPYSEMSHFFGKEAVVALVGGDCLKTDWIRVSREGAPGPDARHSAKVFRPDGNGGMLLINSFAVGHLFREATDHELSSRFLRSQR